MPVDRVLQGSNPAIQVTLTSGSVAVNPSPDSATVTVTRADGTVLINAQAATDGGTGIFTYPLTPTHTALLDVLTATWTFTSGGQQQGRQTKHEVVGGFLCSLSELAAVLTGMTDTQLADARVKIEQRLEKALGVACVPRYARETISGTGGRELLLVPHVRAVRSVHLDGAVISDLASVVPTLLGVYYPAGWTRGYSNYVVGYEHGYDAPDSDITEAALLLAEESYGSSSVDGRIIRTEADNMAITYAVGSSPGPFVGARLNQIIAVNSLRTGVA